MSCVPGRDERRHRGERAPVAAPPNGGKVGIYRERLLRRLAPPADHRLPWCPVVRVQALVFEWSYDGASITPFGARRTSPHATKRACP